MSIWVASPPDLPPAPGLGPVLTAQPNLPRNAQVWGVLAAAAVVASIVAVATDVTGALWASVPIALLSLYQMLRARRAFIAVGRGWVYFRSAVTGASWTRVEGITSVTVHVPRGGMATLRLSGPDFQARMALTSMTVQRPSALHRDLARQVQAQQPETDEKARAVLERWAHARPAS